MKSEKVKTQKTTPEKAVVKKTTAVKAAPKKKTVLKETVYLQYAGREISQQDVLKRVKAYWTKTLKNKVADMKSVTLYLKPEENMAYFVINDDITGSVEL